MSASQFRPQFSIRTLLEITALVALVLAFFFLRRDEKPVIGRYEFVPEAQGRGYPIMFDTQTGQSWERGIDGRGEGFWHPYTPPAPVVKK